jgi:lycopene cyclase domain-containing protein
MFAPHYTYLWVDFFCIVFPFLFSFHPRLQFNKEWRNFALPCLAVALFFLVWDSLFTYLNVWDFSSQYTCGITVVNMPLEECLFFICIPYASVFSYHCYTKYFSINKYKTQFNYFTIALIVFLLVLGIANAQRLYTSVAFILLALFLIYLLYKKVSYLPNFYLVFAFILIPFFLSNGVLTGGFFNRMVVHYNPAHILGIRMYTIPFEDTFYGMLLLLMNVSGFEYMKRKNEIATECTTN